MNQATDSAKPEHHGVVPGGIEKLADPLVLFLDVVAPRFQLFIAVIGRRIAKRGQRVGVRPVGGRVQDAVEFAGQLDRAWNRMNSGRRHGSRSTPHPPPSNDEESPSPYGSPGDPPHECVCVKKIGLLHPSKLRREIQACREPNLNNVSGKSRPWPPLTRISWLRTPAAEKLHHASCTDWLTGITGSCRPCIKSIGGSPGET